MKIRGLLASSLALLFSLSCSNVYGAKGSKKSNKKECLCECCGASYDKDKKVEILSIYKRKPIACRGCKCDCTKNLCQECYKDYVKQSYVSVLIRSGCAFGECSFCDALNKADSLKQRNSLKILAEDIFNTFNSFTFPDTTKRLVYRILQDHHAAMSKKGKQPSVDLAKELYNGCPKFFDLLLNPNTHMDRHSTTFNYIRNKAVEKNERGYCVCCLENNKVLVKFCCPNGEKHKNGQESAGVCVECFPRLRIETDNGGNSFFRCPICKQEMVTGIVKQSFCTKV